MCSGQQLLPRTTKLDIGVRLVISRGQLAALDTRVSPGPDEVARLVAGGMSRREAMQAASRPAIREALSTPGKTYEGAKEIEVTLPSAGGLAEFVGVAPEVSRRQFYIGGQAFGRPVQRCTSRRGLFCRVTASACSLISRPMWTRCVD